jgi:hypothetical protein
MDMSIKKYSTQGRPAISIKESENTKMQADWMIKSLPPAQQQTSGAIRLESCTERFEANNETKISAEKKEEKLKLDLSQTNLPVQFPGEKKIEANHETELQ